MNKYDEVSKEKVLADTVNHKVGLCYFDPFEETLKEFDGTFRSFLTVESGGQVVRKFYIVVAPGETVDYVRLRVLESDALKENYSMKVIIDKSEPSASTYESVPEFNSYKYVNPQAGDFIPVWMLLESNFSIPEILDIEVELEYE